MMVMEVQVVITMIIHMRHASTGFIAHIWDSTIMLLIIQVIIMTHGIGIITGTVPHYTSALTGVGDVDIHIIIHTTTIGMVIMLDTIMVTGMAIMLRTIMDILRMVIIMVQEHQAVAQIAQMPGQMDTMQVQKQIQVRTI